MRGKGGGGLRSTAVHIEPNFGDPTPYLTSVSDDYGYASSAG